MRALLYGSALALSVGFAALAQPPASQSNAPPSASTPPASDASATASAFKAGMTVKDSAGATIGRIVRVGKASDGTATVAVNVDGKTINVAASTLSPGSAGNEVVSSKTKAELKAAPGSPG
jgi:hypothetical protein